jgi:biopolymer transport protein ExbB/TolQ
MFHEEFQLGGPVMWLLFGAWVVMGAFLLERILFWVLRPLTRPASVPGGPAARARFLERVAEDARRNSDRIDGLAQLATSLGLFGTVLGIAKSFFARGADLTLAAPEVLASGLATALFTTVGGIAIFILGQTALLVFDWFADRDLARARRLVVAAGEAR